MADKLNAGMGPHHRPGIRLTPFSRLNWKISDGEPDIRGWEVRTVGGRTIGKINELLVDTDAREVVMLDIDLDGTDRHALAPIRAAVVDKETRVVRIDSSDIDGELPWLSRKSASADDSKRFNDGYARAYGTKGFDRERDFIVDRDDDEVHFRRRDMAAAEVEAHREDERREAELRANELRQQERLMDRSRGDAVADSPSLRYGGRDAAQDAAEIPRDAKIVEEVVVRRRIVSEDEARER